MGFFATGRREDSEGSGRGPKPRKNRVWLRLQPRSEIPDSDREQSHEVVETARWQGLQ